MLIPRYSVESVFMQLVHQETPYGFDSLFVKLCWFPNYQTIHDEFLIQLQKILRAVF